MADEASEKDINDLLDFLSLESREDLKFFALDYVIGLTGSKDGLQLITKYPKLVDKVIELTRDEICTVQRDALVFLLNASSLPCVIQTLETSDIIEDILPLILDKQCTFADKIAMVLVNITRSESGCERVLEMIGKLSKISIKDLCDVLCDVKYNKHVELHYIAMVLANLSRLQTVRLIIFDHGDQFLQQLMSFISYKDSLIRRKGVISILRNCCFEYDHHEKLLNDGILPHLLLPLAGPEEFTDEENDKLPLELQYLEETKQREPDADIRKLLIDTIMLLCSTKYGRCLIKDCNTYLIIRELHKCETNSDINESIEKLIQILIGDEPENGMSNLHDVKIPDNVRKQFEKQA